MPVRRRVEEPKTVYFITFSCFKWIPLFEAADSYDLIYSWFNYLIKNDFKIVGSVIMPNHLHFLLYYPEKNNTLNYYIGNGKRFLAYEIVKRLNQRRQLKILGVLRRGVSEYETKRGKLHRVFNPSFDWKTCDTSEFVNQKLEYIHANPVAGKWNLVDDFVDYPHSSAAYYELGQEVPIGITYYRELV